MKLHRYGSIAAVALAGALSLTACGSDNTETVSGDSASSNGASPAGSTSCASGGGTLNAEGSSAQDNAMKAWTKAFQAACSGVTVNYNPTGSGAGVQSFLSGNVDFAGSDSALKDDEHPKADARCKTGKAIDLPMVVGPIAIAYKLTGVDDLQLSAATAAGIFAGKITTWDAPELKKDNPDAKLPSKPIQSFHRSDESGTTDNFQKWLAAAAPDVWTFSNAKAWKGPGGQGAAKSAGVTSAIAAADGTIGYIEQSFAENAGLGVAKIANDGTNFVALSAESAGKAVEAATVTGTGTDLSLKLDYATKASGAYPIILVTYEIVCEKGLAAKQGELVKSLLTYTSSAAGQGVLKDNGYAPLPESIRGKVATVVAGLS